MPIDTVRLQLNIDNLEDALAQGHKRVKLNGREREMKSSMQIIESINYFKAQLAQADVESVNMNSNGIKSHRLRFRKGS